MWVKTFGGYAHESDIIKQVRYTQITWVRSMLRAVHADGVVP